MQSFRFRPALTVALVVVASVCAAYLVLRPFWRSRRASATPAAEPTKTLPAATKTSAPSPTAAPDTTPSPAVANPLLLELQPLTQAFDRSLQHKGWSRIIVEQTVRTFPGQTYPPPFEKTDLWYELDDEGNVLRMIQTDTDKNGDVINQVVTDGGHSVNLVSGAASTAYERRNVSMISQIFNPARYIDRQTHMARNEDICQDGQACLQFTLLTQEPLPIQDPGGGSSTGFYGERIWVDAVNGQLLKRQLFWQAEGGDEIVIATEVFLFAGKVTGPTDEVLKLLARAAAP